MATQSEIFLLSATLIPVGLSAIVAVRPTNYQFGVGVKIDSGGGTLEIVPPPRALSGSSAAGWGTGYKLGSSESVQASGPATFFLAATGATMLAGVVFGLGSGASFL